MAEDKQNPANKDSRAWWQPALAMFVKLSAWIAVPVIIALYLGAWLDARYGTAPWLFLASVGLAFLVSMSGLVTSALKEFKKIEKLNDKNSKDKPANSDKDKDHKI